MSNKLYASIPNTSGIRSIRMSEAHNDAAPILTVDASDTSLSIGDSITCDLGYQTNHDSIFTGYVKAIKEVAQPYGITINAYGAMIRAVDYFIASTNPEDAYKASNIAAETLVGDLMSMAGLTNYGYDPTNFTFATQTEMEVNLVSAYDFCKQIADILAWHIYADKTGKVWFVDRKPFPDGTPPVKSKTASQIVQVDYLTSERDLRNRIVVYGAEGVYAEASAESPYLPPGFYKTVVASAYWIEDTGNAQLAADYNLELLNRLTYEASITILGDSDLNARDVITVTEASTGLSGDWYIYAIEQQWSDRGFTTGLVLRK